VLSPWKGITPTALLLWGQRDCNSSLPGGPVRTGGCDPGMAQLLADSSAACPACDQGNGSVDSPTDRRSCIVSRRLQTASEPNVIELVRITRCLGRPDVPAGLAVALALLLPDVTTPAHAEAAVKGPITAVQVEARDSSVAEVLTALGAAYNVRYRTSIDLSRPVIGSFKGPLPTIIARVLKDYDYVVKRSAADRIEVIVVKFSGQDSGKVIATGASTYPPELFQPRPPQPSNQQAPDKAITTGASTYPPKLFRPRPPPAASPAQGSDRVISTGAASYPPELFQPRPLAPSAAQGSEKVISTGANSHPAELFRPTPPAAKVP
jgi:hypothetical protein